MVLVISQQTFNDAVQENVDVLGMSPEEAVSEAINQFKAQGVDLSQIVTNLQETDSLKDIVNVVKKLDESISNETVENYIPNLNALKAECNKGLPYKVAAGKWGAYDVVIKLLKKATEKDVKIACLKTMIALMTNQPDLLEVNGREIIMTNLEPNVDDEIQKLTLKWCRECCVMHEMNRQAFIQDHILAKLNVLLRNDNSINLKEVLAQYRALILDDDIRVEFGNAHEHARLIAEGNLAFITKLIEKFKANEQLVNDLLMTISSLLVRFEFCKLVDESGGLEVIHDLMKTFVGNDKIIRQCFKVIKSLAGNDECKSRIIQKGLAPTIANTLSAHKNTISTACAGLHCVAALSLRNSENSKALFEAAVPEVIIEIMKQYPNEKSIQKTASWAIRNMVSRSRYQNKHFLELGVEDILKCNLGKFKEFEYDIKAALRDLDCNVDLNEEWTGFGGKISSDSFIAQK